MVHREHSGTVDFKNEKQKKPTHTHRANILTNTEIDTFRRQTALIYTHTLARMVHKINKD